MISGVIHVPPPSRSPQARITASNASSTLTRNDRLKARFTVRGQGLACSGKTARGSGEAHGTSPWRTGQGKIPWRYASSTSAGDIERLTATTSSPGLGGGNRAPIGGGSIGGYGGAGTILVYYECACSIRI